MTSQLPRIWRVVSQFFATPEELLNFASEQVSEHDLTPVVYQDGIFVTLQPEELSLSLLDGHKWALRVYLAIGDVDMTAKLPGAFLDQNDGTVVLDIGFCVATGLLESALSFSSTDPKKIKIVQTIMRQFKRITSAGVIAFDPNTGKNGPTYKTYRHTADARALSDAGVEWLPLGAKVVFRPLIKA